MSLYQDVRPQTFDEVFGNKAIVQALKKMVKMSPEKRPHAYLFHGKSGTGKTTLARIFAREIGCSGVDLHELNGSDHRGIDDARRVIEQSASCPIASDSRVFIWDECHKMTADAQNAILKIIEDSPPHAYFIFCSTEPEKILKTIRNRCICLQTESLSDSDMTALLDKVLDDIERDVEDEVFESIIITAEGSPRQALTLLELVLSIDASDTESKLSVIERARAEYQVIDLCRILIKGGQTWKKVVECYKGIDAEPEQIRRAILGYCKAILLGNSNMRTMNRAALLISYLEGNTFDLGEPKLVKDLFEFVTTVDGGRK